MLRKKICYYMFMVGLASGCATQSKSVGAGAAIGAVGGAAIGGIADGGKNGKYRTRNVVVGATLGTMVGAVSGSVLYDKIEKAKTESAIKGRKPEGDGVPPNLSDPKIEARWIEGRAQGNRWIDGHWEYVILEPARWEGKP